MAKHKRWSDKLKKDSTENLSEYKTEENPNLEESKKHNSFDLKSTIISGIKYIYIIAIAALFSGIFTPLTLGVEYEDVIFGMLSLFLGLVGGIMIFLGIRPPNSKTILIFVGLGMIIASSILIYEVAQRSLFV